ncbi:DNA alkylation repair protein [Chitinophaga rhizophila]|uniref:DNA alkylation repair protein n=1 Tax=Chitinophaga rhizophila TaxID=2866212 RepID=A0ABS7G594_9BACT|nr:DNA alkylation repair protein [Chitinophaga rhizophila]MBW8682788.1 DNA alkylation repair protein [Chitinophaga rhizophila]
MSLLKDLYSPAFYNGFADVLAQTLPAFNKRAFIKRIYQPDFEAKELKERMKHTTAVLHTFLPADYEKAVTLIDQIIQALKKAGYGEALEFIFLPDYLATYGLEHYTASVKALESVTQFITCEFAVRPFLIRYGDKMMQQMLKWSVHKHAKVRRLASEGSRPRLPWAMAVPFLKKDPTPVLPILENLKQDPSESVRRSVANNLNDIAKDHPAIVIGIATKWKGLSKETDAIIKHGCRTLLKQGSKEILAHYGLKSTHVAFRDYKILTPKVNTGDSLEFSFTIRNTDTQAQTIRLEYAVYYLKQNGTLSKKVFKISEKTYAAGEQVTVIRKQSFRLITTRVFYPGKHQLSVIINGAEQPAKYFELI